MDTELSPLDCLMPWTYIRQIFCFPSASSLAPRTLRDGLSGTIHDVPYLASYVARSEYPRRAVSLTTPTQTADDIFSWQDLTATSVSPTSGVDYSYSALKATNFSPAYLSAIPALAPPETDAPLADLAPVLRATLTLIHGGSLLCVAVHHSTTDITGFGALLDLWAAHCRTESSMSLGFQPSWLDRTLLAAGTNLGVDSNGEGGGRSESPGTAPDPGVPELLRIRDDTPAGSVQPKGTSQKSTQAIAVKTEDAFETCIFHFPASSLTALKTAANASLASLESVEGSEVIAWVSTLDVLTAILWSAVVASETHSKEDPATSQPSASPVPPTSTIGIPVNFRAHLGLPLRYLGAAFAMTAASVPRDTLLRLSRSSFSSSLETEANTDATASELLARVASSVRHAIHCVDVPRIRSMLRYLARSHNTEAQADGVVIDLARIELGPRRDAGASIVSWADQHGARRAVPDWGPALGPCEAVRTMRLRGRRWPIVLPRLGDEAAGLEVVMSLEKGAMHELKEGPLMRRWASLRCSN